MQTERDDLAASSLAVPRLEAAFGSVLCAGRRNHTRDRCLFTLVCAYTERLQAQGVLVERVIVRLKQVAASAAMGAPESAAQSSDELAVMDDVLSTAVTWCIEHYYRHDPAPSCPSATIRTFESDSTIMLPSASSDAVSRMAKAADLLRRYEQAQATHELLVNHFNNAVSSARSVRTETEFLWPIRQRMRDERAALRATIGNEVARLVAQATPPDQIIVVLQDAVLGALWATPDDSHEQLRRDALDWTLEALFAA